MAELKLLQEIAKNLNSIIQGIQTLIYVGGVIIALLLVNLFGKNWGRNT